MPWRPPLSHGGDIRTVDTASRRAGGGGWRLAVFPATMAGVASKPPGGRSLDTTALEHFVDHAPDAVPRALRFAAEALTTEVGSSVVEDAELVVTELVT